MDIKLSDISFSYPLGGGKTRRALEGVNLLIEKGHCLGVIGPEGAGKTTLLFIMDMLLTPEQGSVLIDGVNVWKEKGTASHMRKRIGLEFQFPEQQFVAETVEEELLFAVSPQSENGTVSPAGALEAVGLDPAHFLKRSPFHLSVGEARRVALASLLIKRPELLLLDEPTVGLDGPGKEDFLRSIRAHQKMGTTLVIVSHDLDFLSELATHIVVFNEGHVFGSGPVHAVMRDPALLSMAGYDQPELITILDQLAEKGKVPQGAFLRPEEIVRLTDMGLL